MIDIASAMIFRQKVNGLFLPTTSNVPSGALGNQDSTDEDEDGWNELQAEGCSRNELSGFFQVTSRKDVQTYEAAKPRCRPLYSKRT